MKIVFIYEAKQRFYPLYQITSEERRKILKHVKDTIYVLH